MLNRLDEETDEDQHCKHLHDVPELYFGNINSLEVPLKFRKKPVVIDAIQWTGQNLVEISRFCPTCHIWAVESHPIVLIIPTLEGDHLASVGDWIIKGVAGEFYPCKPEIFALTYEVVDELF